MFCSRVFSVLAMTLYFHHYYNPHRSTHPSTLLHPAACQMIERRCQGLIISLPTKNKQNIKHTKSTEGLGLVPLPVSLLYSSFCSSFFSSFSFCLHVRGRVCIRLPAGELFDVFCRFRAHIVSAVLFLLRWLYSYRRLWQLGVFEDHDGEGGAIKPEKRATDSAHGRRYVCVCEATWVWGTCVAVV